MIWLVAGLALLLGAGASAQRFRGGGYSQVSPVEPGPVPTAEFEFARMIYRDLPSRRGGECGAWWCQDYREAEDHFFAAVTRLTRIRMGDGKGVTVALTDDKLFDYPWLYATQVGYWDLSDEEVDRMREYLLRGGFLMTDDFWGQEDWYVFSDTMKRVFPDRPMLDIPKDDPALHVMYDIDEFTQIPGLRMLDCYGGRGGGRMSAREDPAEWHGIYDDDGRLMVAVNFNQDVGDAWEEADTPCYPEPMTALAYRIAINYAIYSMTH
jgi:Domain of unknown function (DUF4159)